jgi:hypothetical protein
MVTTKPALTSNADAGTSAATATHPRPRGRPSGNTSSSARKPTSCHGHAPAPITDMTPAPHHGAPVAAVRPHASTAGVATMNAASHASAAPTGLAGARTAISQPRPSGTTPSSDGTKPEPSPTRAGPNVAKPSASHAATHTAVAADTEIHARFTGHILPPRGPERTRASTGR